MAQEHPGKVDIDNVKITKEQGNSFLITASGDAPDGEYDVQLVADGNDREPEDRLINVTAKQTDIHPHHDMRWECSISLVLGQATRRVTVKASNKAITVDVPH